MLVILLTEQISYQTHTSELLFVDFYKGITCDHYKKLDTQMNIEL